MKDVTVIITHYNRPKEMLDRAVASVKAQTYPVKRMTTDKTDAVYLSWYKSVYKAETPFVAILHDDDWYEPEFIERCMALFDESVGYVFSEAMIHFPHKQRTNLQAPFSGLMPSSAIEEMLMSGGIYTLSPSCCVFRREDLLQNMLVGGVPGVQLSKDVQCGVDLLMVLLPCLKYKFVGAVKDPLVNFDAHAGSVTIDAIGDGHRKKLLELGYAQARQFYGALRHVCRR